MINSSSLYFKYDAKFTLFRKNYKKMLAVKLKKIRVDPCGTEILSYNHC